MELVDAEGSPGVRPPLGHALEFAASLPPALADASAEMCALGAPSPECLPVHLARARSTKDRALATLLFVNANRPDKLTDEALSVSRRFFSRQNRSADRSFLKRTSRCAACGRGGLALEPWTLCSSAAVPVRTGAAGPDPSFPLSELCGALGGGAVLTDSSGSRIVHSLYRRSDTIGYSPDPLRQAFRRSEGGPDPGPEGYRYCEVVLGHRTSATSRSSPVVGRLCSKELSFWVEVTSDGSRGAVYRFLLPTGKAGFLGATPGEFSVSLLNFLILWFSGARNRFPPRPGEPVPEIRRSLEREAARLARFRTPPTDPVQVLLPTSAAAFEPTLDLLLADALRTAYFSTRERPAPSGNTAASGRPLVEGHAPAKKIRPDPDSPGPAAGRGGGTGGRPEAAEAETEAETGTEAGTEAGGEAGGDRETGTEAWGRPEAGTEAWGDRETEAGTEAWGNRESETGTGASGRPPVPPRPPRVHKAPRIRRGFAPM